MICSPNMYGILVPHGVMTVDMSVHGTIRISRKDLEIVWQVIIDIFKVEYSFNSSCDGTPQLTQEGAECHG